MCEGCAELKQGPYATVPTGPWLACPVGREVRDNCAELRRNPHATVPTGGVLQIHMGHNVRAGCAELGEGTARDGAHWGRTWGSLLGTKCVGGVPNWAEGAPAQPPPQWAVAGAPLWGAGRARGAPI